MAVVVAIDAGTTGVRSLAVDGDARVVAARYQEFPQYFPRPGEVEHDPEEIWAATVATLAALVADLEGEPIAAIGLTNQRETLVVWDRDGDRPLHRAIVWQDRRSAPLCQALHEAGHLDLVRGRTGLVLDPYFSATKLAWLLGAEPSAAAGAFGTVDSWLLWRLSGGKVHATDTSNASRTMLFDTARLAWDGDLLDLFGVPASMLPEVVPSSGRVAVTAAGAVPGLAAGVPLSGLAGDQQAALFGQACFAPGMAKNTYGTGSFVLMNMGTTRPEPVEGLLTTVAWTVGGRTAYALEGSIFVTGAALQWLRDGLGVIAGAGEAGPLAESLADNGGLYFVPALTGLGSPWWDPGARGTVVGLTRGCGRAHLVRAAVEAMAYQTADVVAAMAAASSQPPAELRVDGGASVMGFLLQFQADLLGVPVRRAASAETTALGAALLAGLAEGVWSSLDEVAGLWRAGAEALPGTRPAAAYDGWRRAVERARA